MHATTYFRIYAAPLCLYLKADPGVGRRSILVQLRPSTGTITPNRRRCRHASCIHTCAPSSWKLLCVAWLLASPTHVFANVYVHICVCACIPVYICVCVS
ncbi:hypothetical protein EON63_13915 [archaeon]|nr:MAG: hypothetical protein EON63_13915 [archaeon]